MARRAGISQVPTVLWHLEWRPRRGGGGNGFSDPTSTPLSWPSEMTAKTN